MQLAAQSAERAGYGKGVEEILIKPDSSLPLFVAIVYVAIGEHCDVPYDAIYSGTC